MIRVVVRREAPNKQRILSAAPLSRARSVRDNDEHQPRVRSDSDECVGWMRLLADDFIFQCDQFFM